MKTKLKYYLPAFLSIVMLMGCSTQKNTWKTRSFHAFTTRYNVYFNGHQAYLKGEKALNNAHKDDFTKPISLYRISDVGEKAGGGSDFDLAIEKSKIAIKAHSIKVKPKKNRNKLKDPKYIRFINQEEFNPFLYNAWFLWGKSLYHKGDFMGASSVFSYIMRHYVSDEKIVNEARIWQMRCYNDMKWFYEAEDLIHKTEIEKLEGKSKSLYTAAYCDYLLKQKKYKEAIPYLKEALKSANKDEKMRWQFLLAQLYQMDGQKEEAYNYYGKVIRKNPPYVTEISARIKQTEVATGSNTQKSLSKLKRMAKNGKNLNYLDMVYYALGNLYLQQGDTVKALESYGKGVSLSKRGGIDKAVCFLKMGDIYYAQHKYMHAQPCYSQAFGLFSKESEEYKRLAILCPALDDMSVYARNIEEQDSIQALARMPEAEKMKVINAVIEQVKKAKKEAQAEDIKAQMEKRGGRTAPTTNRPTPPTPKSTNVDKSWYFYNQTAMTEGKSAFQQKWGNRKLEDNWRRKTKDAAILPDAKEDTPQTPGDSTATNTAGGSLKNDSTKVAAKDSLEDELETPEYYLAQLPTTPEEFEASNVLIREGLYNVGLILKNNLNDYDAALTSFESLLARFPENDFLADTYYNLFQIYYRKKDKEKAEYYRLKLINEFPDNENAILLADPNFEHEFLMARQIQDSVYVDTYKAYLEKQSGLVKSNYELIRSKYPKAELMPKYMLVYALSLLKEGDKEGFKEIIELLLKEYPASDVSELATAIGKGIYEGRDLADGGDISSSIWERKLAANDSTKTDSVKISFSDEKETPYLLLLAYPSGTVDNNKLLFNVASYNFSNFLVKNFDLANSTFNDIELLIVSGFATYDDIMWYKQMFYEREVLDVDMNRQIRPVIISVKNYDLLKKYFSFDDYFKYYEEHYNQPDIPLTE